MSRARNTKREPADVVPEMDWRPVPSRRRDKAKSRVAAIVEELKKHPGKSARVVRNARSTSATATWKKYGCVAQIRQAEDDPNLHDVYAWWPDPDQGKHAGTEETD